MGYPFSPPGGDEEALNQQFTGFLYYSLQNGPALLNRIHRDHPLSFSDEARVVAHQDSPLPLHTETVPIGKLTGSSVMKINSSGTSQNIAIPSLRSNYEMNLPSCV